VSQRIMDYLSQLLSHSLICLDLRKSVTVASIIRKSLSGLESCMHQWLGGVVSPGRIRAAKDKCFTFHVSGLHSC